MPEMKGLCRVWLLIAAWQSVVCLICVVLTAWSVAQMQSTIAETMDALQRRPIPAETYEPSEQQEVRRLLEQLRNDDDRSN